MKNRLKLKCKQGHLGHSICGSPYCRSPSVCCKHKQCLCQKQHSYCKGRYYKVEQFVSSLDIIAEQSKQPLKLIYNLIQEQRLQLEQIYEEFKHFYYDNVYWSQCFEKSQNMLLGRILKGHKNDVFGEDVNEFAKVFQLFSRRDPINTIKQSLKDIGKNFKDCREALKKLWKKDKKIEQHTHVQKKTTKKEETKMFCFWQQLSLSWFQIHNDLKMYTSIPSVEQARNIKVLQIDTLPISILPTFFESTSSLQQLAILNGGNKVNDQWCKQALKYLDRLRVLDIRNSNVTDRGVQVLGKRLQGLRYLGLFGCKYLSKDIQVVLKKMMPNTNVWVQQNQEISSNY